MKRSGIATIFILVLLSALVAGCNAVDQQVSVEDIWARPAGAGENSAVYFKLVNSTGQDEVLIAAHGDIADRVEIHQTMIDQDQTMRMMQQESVPVLSGGEVVFEPGGLHVMLIQLGRDLNPGDTFRLGLEFEGIGDVEIEVPVRSP